MKQLPKISDAEWQIMQLFWAKGKATANQIVEALQKQNDWKPKTIKTLINRLTSKGALGYDRQGREYIYYPLISEDESVKAKTNSFLPRLSKSALKPMLAAFVEQHNLSQEDIDELKEILEKKKEGK